MPETTDTASEVATVTGGDLCRLTGMSLKQVHTWCLAGVFGPEHQHSVGSGNYRRFDPDVLVVARACRRLTEEWDPDNAKTGGGSNLPARILAAVADQVRSGADVVRVGLGDHVELTVDVGDLREAGE